MLKFTSLWFQVFGLLLIFAINAEAQSQLNIAGTGDSQKILRILAQAFEANHPGADVVVPESIGSSGGIRTLINGGTDLARIARSLKEKELAQAPDLQVHWFARSPVVFLANLPEPCIDDLSEKQVVGIFSGSYSDWSELGDCPEHKIYVALREEGDSSRTVIEKKIEALAVISEPVGKVLYSTPKTADTIGHTPFTFGYLPLPAIRNKSLKVFAFDGISPSAENIRTGSYPLTTDFGLVWRGELAGLAAQFIDFIGSSAAKTIIIEAGLVPISGK